MRVETIQRKHRSVLERCHNGCKAGNVGGMSETGYRVASHRVWLIGYPTPVCSECAANWERWYGEALTDAEAVAA